MRDHKSLIAWQRARRVVDAVVRASQHHWTPSAGAIISQLQRSALSTQLNIAEGYARNSQRQFRFHLNVAYGSAVETIELLELLQDHALLPQDLVQRALTDAIDTRGLLLGLLRRYT
jgi:four helix bundle protein